MSFATLAQLFNDYAALKDAVTDALKLIGDIKANQGANLPSDIANLEAALKRIVI